MAYDPVFNGRAILVTRAPHQAGGFCGLVESCGGEAVRFPTLEIRGLPAADCVLADPESLKRFDWLIFISANAVYFALKACDNVLLVPARTSVAAIGEATAAALKRNGIPVDLFPSERFNSEAFLELPRMQSVAGLRFLIVRGKGGREALAETLRARGAQVVYAEVYQRLRPEVDIRPHLEGWCARGIDAITIFSGESLMNFVAMLGEKGLARVREIPLVVVGQKVAAQAEHAGFQKVIVAANASDRAMFDTLADHFRSGAGEGSGAGTGELKLPFAE